MSTNAPVARVLMALGVVLFAAGLVLGFLPHSAGGVSCGSAFHRNSNALSADFSTALQADSAGVSLADPSSHQAACSSARSTAKFPAVLLLVLGAGLVTAGGLGAALKWSRDGASDRAPS